MDWMDALNQAIEFMEEHLLDDITAEEVSKSVNTSNFYFQKGFKIMTGFTVTEYIRNRRLTLAGQELLYGQEKVINLAYKYGYDTPESFSKAFSRYHGITPAQVKRKGFQLKSFKRLLIKITVEGGNKMDYRIEKKEAFQLAGMRRSFSFETSYREIPKFWDEFSKMDCPKEIEEIMPMYGVCIDDLPGEKEFSYLVAGDYKGGKVPEGFEVVEIPAYTWAIFPCVGPMPESLQSVNTRIFSEWLPNNNEYEIAAGMNIEMYTYGDTTAKDYLSEIWIPVKKKGTIGW